MAILRGADGKFYDVEDSVLEGKEVNADTAKNGPPPGAGSGGGAPPSGLIQIVLNMPPGSGAPPSIQGAAGDDVAGHSGGHGGHCWHNCWYNCWHNCWQNHHWHNHHHCDD